MSVTRVIWVDTKKKNRFHWHTRLIKRCKLKQFSLNKDTKNHAERCSSPTPSGLLWDGDSRRSNPWPSPRMFLQREALQARGNHALQYGGGLWENHFMYRIWSSSRRFQGLLYAYVFFFFIFPQNYFKSNISMKQPLSMQVYETESVSTMWFNIKCHF